MDAPASVPARRRVSRSGRTAVLRCALTLGLGLLATAAFPAMTDSDQARLEADQAAVNTIAHQLQQSQFKDADVQRLLEQVGGYRGDAADCIGTAQARAAQIAAQSKLLGPPAAGESALATATRASLAARQRQAERMLSDCRLLAVTSDEVLSGLQELQNTALTNRLLAPGTPTVLLIRRLLSRQASPTPIFDAQHLLRRLGAREPRTRIWLGALTLVGLIGGLIRRRRWSRITPIDPAQDLSGAVIQTFGLSLNRYRPGLLISGLWSLYWLAVGPAPAGWPLLAWLSFILFGYHLALVAIRSSFNPPPPARSYLPFAKPLARRFSEALHLLALLSVVGALLFATPIAEAAAPDLILVARSLWAGLLVLNLIWTLGLIRRLRGKQSIGLVRLTIALALVAGLAAEWLGYRHLGAFVIGGVVQTVVCLLLAWLVSTVGGDLLDSLGEGRRHWERRLRARLGVAEGALIPGMFWLRVLMHILIWALLSFALLRIWGLPSSAQSMLFGWMTQGFRIGQFTIEPLRVLIALMALALLLTFSAWGRTQLDRHLTKTRMERGAREAAVLVSGYGMMIGVALIALSIAGVSFQNLTIIAGALSVGLGFGLQNIVNNFVSGLILLFERPIRTGDWIIVGGVEGHVRRISIRSTQIETFDRADVIVPNSELISGSVTNWVLRDSHARVRVPVGVAYGSDTQAVKALLLGVAREHPQVIYDNPVVPNPYVWFLSFGDSALNFELCAFVRDAEQRLTVVSDLNFAIDAAFRSAGVQIPFPQRDLHIIKRQPSRQGRSSE